MRYVRAVFQIVLAPAILFMASPQQYQVRATATTFSRDYGGNAGSYAVTCIYRTRAEEKVPATQPFIFAFGRESSASFWWVSCFSPPASCLLRSLFSPASR